MVSDFSEDKIENEKPDLNESSSLDFVNIPIILLSLLVGFGATYLALRTDNTRMNPGDSRTVEVAEGSASSSFKEKEEPPQPTNLTLEERIAMGKKGFEENCMVCHQADGQGVPDTFPPLAESEWVNGSAERMIAIVLYGIDGEINVKGKDYNDVMPTFYEVLSHDEIANIVSYVRQAFGNDSGPVERALVEKVYKKVGPREDPWEGGDAINKLSWD